MSKRRALSALAVFAAIALGGAGAVGLVLASPLAPWQFATSGALCLLSAYWVILHAARRRDDPHHATGAAPYNTRLHVLGQAVVVVIGVATMALAGRDVRLGAIGWDTILLAAVGAYCVYAGASDMPPDAASWLKGTGAV